jgi:hypothetical protein
MLLEEHELWYLVEKEVALAIDVALLVEYDKKTTKQK